MKLEGGDEMLMGGLRERDAGEGGTFNLIQ